MASSVSVIIPVFNGAAYLAQTIDSVLSQTAPVAEIIIVDDGSTDESAAIAERFGPKVQRMPQHNAGVSSARNAGFAVAKSKFVCFVDQDDVWHPKMLERQLAVFEQQPETGVVVAPFQHWWPTSEPVTERCFPPEPGSDLDPDFTGWVFHQFMQDCWALTSATLLRREVLDAHGVFDTEQAYGEDWELWLRLSRCVRFAKLTWPPVLYRQHVVQGSRRARPIDYRSNLLLAAAQAHGLSSEDGRSVPLAVFNRTVARYQMEFGYHHLAHGCANTGIASLLRAWRRDPARVRYLALAAAAAIGWRPGSVDARRQQR